jgi:hypothetical protein
MKNTFKCLGIIALVAVIGFMATGCSTTTDLKSNMVGEYNLIPKIAGKDFVVLGLVSVNTRVVETTSPLKITNSTQGERITFDRLLQEARTRYPDVSDIINVRVDKVDRSRKGTFDFFTGTTTTTEYFGNALAIRYTDALPEGETPIPGSSGTLPGGVSGTSGSGSFLSTLPIIGGFFE